MTDLLDDLEPGVAGAPPVDYCQRPGCDLPLPDGHHPMRKYCDEHQPKQSKKTGDKAPKSVTVNFKTSTPKTSKSGPAEEVRAGATSALTFVALGFQFAGDMECGAAVMAQTPQIAAQLAELAQYHPALAKVFSPVNAQGEAAAWLGLAIAVAPVVIAILAHHNLLPVSVAEKLGGLAGAFMAATPAETPVPDAAA